MRYLESKWRRPLTLTLMFPLGDADAAKENERLVAFESHFRELDHPVKEVTHFLRLFRLPGEPSRLVLSVVFDGDSDSFLQALVSSSREQLLCVLADVSESSVVSEVNDAELVQWLSNHRELPAAYHVGTLADSISEIESEERLYVELSRYLDTHPELRELPFQNIKNAMKNHVVELGLVSQRRPAESWMSILFRRLDVIGVFVSAMVIPTLVALAIVLWRGFAPLHIVWLSPLVLVLLIVALFLIVRILEIVEKDVEMWPDAEHVKSIVEREDIFVQNQITLVAEVRNSCLRRIIMRLALWIGHSFSKHWYQRGVLAGIDTIHFARFHLVDGGRRMVFISDYDGTWGKYLFDFTGVGSLAVIPIWASLNGCPKARFQRWPTPGFAQRFLPFTRRCQIVTACWYSRYPNWTVAEIKRNQLIRDGLFDDLTERQVADWLKLFGGRTENVG